MLISATIPASALLLDRWLGEATRWHPLVGFGNLANYLEQQLNAPTFSRAKKLAGIIAVSLLIIPLVVIGHALSLYIGAVFDLLILYFALGARSLSLHAQPIITALKHSQPNELQAEESQPGEFQPRKFQLDQARHAISRIVSRDTQSMNSNDIARANVESILENGNDAVFASLFWYVIAGPAGVILHRLSNTLDAMWGYRTPRFNDFGWAAARLDDLLNYLPARLTALTYALLGNIKSSLCCWQQQAKTWDSPNAGPVMAAGAGSLNILIGGTSSYHGKLKHRPQLGSGQPASADDIPRALKLVNNGAWLWCIVIITIALTHHSLGL